MAAVDPLRREPTTHKSEQTGMIVSPANDEVTKKPFTYYKGFFDAEQRRPHRHAEETPGRVIFASIMGALPFAALIFFLSRRSAKKSVEAAKAAASGEKPKKGFFSEVMEQMQKQMNPMQTKDFQVTVKDTKFKDVIGVPEALEEVRQYVEFLKSPQRFVRLGGRLPKGCLLTGSPGTGKTLLAKAVAGEADVPFFTCSGADFIEVYAGSGPKRVRDLFDAAKKAAPSVIFVDEIDAVGSRSSGSSAGGIGGEENRTVNQLLAELDGLQREDSIVVFAATNFPDNIDKALLREGRFDRKVEIPMPDEAARVDLFTHYLRRVITGDPESTQQTSSPNDNSNTPGSPNSNNTDVTVSTTPQQQKQSYQEIPVIPGRNKELATRLAGLTPGISPATIATIVNEAALAAAVAGDAVVGDNRLLPAIDDVLVGKKHRNRMGGSASRRVALHESGHALVAWMLPQQSRVIKLSITPRGNAAGFTQQLGKEVREHQTDRSMFTDICVMLGGRIAESSQHTNLTTGAQDDYQRATKLALNQFLAFGMSRNVGLLAYDYQRLDQGRMYQLVSETTQRAAEKEAAKLVQIAFDFTTKLLKTHESKLKALENELAEKRELLEEDIIRVVGARPIKSGVDDQEVQDTISKALAEFTQAALDAGRNEETLQGSNVEGGVGITRTNQQLA
ncbi:ATP-dependent zinc metallopeptidase, putative [Bodo saltans]|uniref:ATP-dependent zinc metallopeptidase, putative n=1 Tax=Bodo saltans TaxID=75058 RepID=A0A0S4JGG9_BODSA|nr:ATP-dependent zinc metallopeptidase, putative [Bodo saltans]|eukprot:CUG87496.1 ATP-dependent zinc metallopeptidase, putative [Bodo saltans]